VACNPIVFLDPSGLTLMGYAMCHLFGGQLDSEPSGVFNHLVAELAGPEASAAVAAQRKLLKIKKGTPGSGRAKKLLKPLSNIARVAWPITIFISVSTHFSCKDYLDDVEFNPQLPGIGGTDLDDLLGLK